MNMQLERCFMKDFVDRWMDLTLTPKLTYSEIDELEGGSGKNRCRTIEDALNRPGTWPHRWFLSDQSDTEAYGEPRYIYSLWWAAYNFSLDSYDLVAKVWPSAIKGHVVGDVGGSLFSAFRLINLGAKKVYVYNFPNSPQGQIIRFFSVLYGVPIEVTSNHETVKKHCESLVMKAYLEHFRNVDEEMDKWIGSLQPFMGDIITDNSFNEVSYGHYIPLQIDGEDYHGTDEAHEAFSDNMIRRGWTASDKVRNPNSSKKFICRWSLGL